MGRIICRGCTRNYWITLDYVSCDLIVPGTATQGDNITPLPVSYKPSFTLSMAKYIQWFICSKNNVAIDPEKEMLWA